MALMAERERGWNAPHFFATEEYKTPPYLERSSFFLSSTLSCFFLIHFSFHFSLSSPKPKK